MKRKENKTRKIPEKVKSVAELISAAIVVGGALIGAGKWLSTEINASTNARVDALEEKIGNNHTQQELATTRLELMVLMEHDPDNVVEIEKLARHYFLDLKGNMYMTSVFSKWCAVHGLSCAEIVLK